MVLFWGGGISTLVTQISRFVDRDVEPRGGKDSAGRQGQRSGGPTCGDPGAAPLMAQMGRDLDDLGQMVAFQVC